MNHQQLHQTCEDPKSSAYYKRGIWSRSSARDKLASDPMPALSPARCPGTPGEPPLTPPPPPSNRLRTTPCTPPFPWCRKTVHGSSVTRNNPREAQGVTQPGAGLLSHGWSRMLFIACGVKCLGSVRQVVVLCTGTCTGFRPPKRASLGPTHTGDRIGRDCGAAHLDGFSAALCAHS